MKSNSYSERQIEAANLLNSNEIPAETIDQILTMMGEAEKRPNEPTANKEETETSIKLKLMDEKDWRKRAALSAMLISKSLEDY